MRFYFGLGFAILALAACSAAPPVVDANRAQIAAPALSQTPRVNAPNFGDADPHDWQGRSPQSYPVHGIDASRWQGAADWETARKNGVSFAYFKATEGGDLVDPAFKTHWDSAARADLPRGAYHYFYFCRPAAEQARWFIRNVPKSAKALPPVLDMEWTPFSKTCTQRPDASHIRREAAIFIADLTRHYGQRPLLYTTVDFFHENQMWKLPSTEFWLRSVADHPSQTYPGQAWTFWQYSGTGLVPGIQGKVDLNSFAGSIEKWQAWLARSRP